MPSSLRVITPHFGRPTQTASSLFRSRSLAVHHPAGVDTLPLQSADESPFAPKKRWSSLPNRLAVATTRTLQASGE